MNPEDVGGQTSQVSDRWRMPAWFIAACIMAIAIGAAGMVVAFFTNARQGWLWLVVDFVLFWGVLAGMLLWAAVFRTAQATWTSVINRIGHGAIYCVVWLLALLIALLVGLPAYAPWAKEPVRGLQIWLNPLAFIIRQVVVALLFYIPCFLLVRWSLAADIQQITDRKAHHINVAAVVAVFMYCVTATFIAWDFIMSLSPKWVSTMFSAYYFCTNAYAGVAALALFAAAFRRPLGLIDRLKPQIFYDLGNLMLGFSLFNMGLFFAQYVTIWYENLPNEVPFIILRYVKGDWPPISWTSFMLGYAIPFLLLQSRMIKLRSKLLSVVAVIILIGVGIERYILVAPSVEPQTLFIAPAGALSVLGFTGLTLLSVGWFMGRYSSSSAADEALTLERLS